MVGDLAHPTSKRLPMYRQTKSTTNLQVSFLKQKESQTQERSCVPVSMGNGFLSTFFLSPKWENQHLSPLVLGGCHRDSPRPFPHLPPGTSPPPPRQARTPTQHHPPLPPLAAPPAAPSRAPDSPAQPSSGRPTPGKQAQERASPAPRPWLRSAQ
jgi:hypothetical protein